MANFPLFHDSNRNLFAQLPFEVGLLDWLWHSLYPLASKTKVFFRLHFALADAAVAMNHQTRGREEENVEISTRSFLAQKYFAEEGHTSKKGTL